MKRKTNTKMETEKTENEMREPLLGRPIYAERVRGAKLRPRYAEYRIRQVFPCVSSPGFFMGFLIFRLSPKQNNYSRDKRCSHGPPKIWALGRRPRWPWVRAGPGRTIPTGGSGACSTSARCELLISFIGFAYSQTPDFFLCLSHLQKYA